MNVEWNHHTLTSKIARDHQLDIMRRLMVARWSFKPFDIALIQWCSGCGSANHYAVIRSITHTPGRSVAKVEPLTPCHQKELSLVFALPFGGPFDNAMLKVRHRVIKEHKEKYGNIDPAAAVDCG